MLRQHPVVEEAGEMGVADIAEGAAHACGPGVFQSCQAHVHRAVGLRDRYADKA